MTVFFQSIHCDINFPFYESICSLPVHTPVSDFPQTNRNHFIPNMAKTKPISSSFFNSLIEIPYIRVFVFLPSFLAIASAPGPSLVSKIIDSVTLAEVLVAVAFLTQSTHTTILESEQIRIQDILRPSLGFVVQHHNPILKPQSAQLKQGQIGKKIISLVLIFLSLILLVWFREKAFLLGSNQAVLSDSSLALYLLWSVVALFLVDIHDPNLSGACALTPAGYAAVGVFLNKEKRPLEREGTSPTLLPMKAPPTIKLQKTPSLLETPESGSIKRARRAKKVSIRSTTEVAKQVPTPIRNKAGSSLLVRNFRFNENLTNDQEQPLAALTALSLLLESTTPRTFSLQGTPFNTSIETFTTRRGFRESERTQQSRASYRPTPNHALEEIDLFSSQAPTEVDLIQINPLKKTAPTSYVSQSYPTLHLELLHFGLLFWIFRFAMRNVTSPAKFLRNVLRFCIIISSRILRFTCQIVFFFPLLLVRMLIKPMKMGTEIGTNAFEVMVRAQY